MIDERHKANGYNQLLAHEVSTDGGRTWSGEVYDVAINNGAARPGMAVVTRMGNGQYAMSFEACSTSPNCGVHVKISSDGDNWSNASDLGSLVQSSNGNYLCCTPYITWAPTGGPNGTLYVAGKIEYTSGGSVASGSGSTLMANNNFGSGQWYPATAPLQFTPIESGCNGWSQPLVAVGSTLMQMASTALPGSTTRCQIRFASATMYDEVVNRNSGKVLDVAYCGTADGTIVRQWTWLNNTCQRWTVASNSSRYYVFTNANSGKVLDVVGASTTDGAQIDQWSNNGGANQQWSLVSVGSGYYKIVSRNSGKVLDVAGLSTADGAQVQQWSDNGGSNQQWSLIPA